ncbi:hypothetical protein [Phocaeicola dorei]|jgi:hypothetical protein|uniref:hypothetical protein n=1 Tax=Phocaeicola dorei TaxID=357276 RepID=UPI001BDEFE63|nr:hypothetical protein [Phocaeicola dorei]MBT1285911.1 hypothetical protein [Phocaeicola dorei]MBT1289779.1 hypothetical protein [Phocaeicola dorei]
MGVSDSVQFSLRPKDLEKASELLGIELATLERFNSQRLLNVTYIRSLLIRADYERLTSGLHWLEHQDKNYNFPEVMRALQREYNISKANLNKILHGRNESILFCNRCGIRITKKCHERTNGLCSNCFADDLEL